MTVQWRRQTLVAGADAKEVGPEPVYQYLADRLVVADEVQQCPTIWGKRIPGPAGKADAVRTVHPAPPRVQPGSFNMKSKIPSAHQAQPYRLRGGPRSGVRGEPVGVAHVCTIGSATVVATDIPLSNTSRRTGRSGSAAPQAQPGVA